MAQQLIWDKEVVEQIVTVGEYLFEKFGKSTAEKFVQNLYAQAQRLTHHPELGWPSKIDGQTRFLLVGKPKRHRLYYRVDGVYVKIIFLFDTKQEPETDPFQ